MRVSRRRGAVLVKVTLGTLSARRLVSDIVGSSWLMILLSIPESVRILPNGRGCSVEKPGDFRCDWGSSTTHLGVVTRRMTTWLAHDLEPA